MKPFLIVLGGLALSGGAQSQIICITCQNQNGSYNPSAPNLITNGSFEASNCVLGGFTGFYCPNSGYYNCDIANWICTDGGTSTYASAVTTDFSIIPDGSAAAYMGNWYCTACIGGEDDCLSSNGCTFTNVSAAQIFHSAEYGGSSGVSLEQTVAGLTPDSIYIFEFWAGGEDESSFPKPGLFAVDIGFGYTFLACHGTFSSAGTRYIIEFRATSASHKIKITNWGHICSTCTEVVIDDARLYKLSEAINKPDCEILNVELIRASLCPGDTFTFNSLAYTAVGSYWDTVRTASDTTVYQIIISILDCDTIIYELVDTALCSGNTFILNEKTYSEAGIFRDTVQSGNVITLYEITISTKTCDIDVPDAFSPNADGKNDHFTVFAENLSDYEIWIYNRWGEQVYYSNDLSELNNLSGGWDGRYKGKLQDLGVFVYRISAKNLLGEKIDLTGNVLLAR